MEDDVEEREKANVFNKFHIVPFQHIFNHARKILKLREAEQSNKETNDNINNEKDNKSSDLQNVTVVNYLEELSEPPKSYDGQKLGDKIEKLWLAEVERNKKPSLMRVLIKTLMIDYIRGTSVNLLIKLFCMIITFNSIRIILNAVDDISNLRSNYLLYSSLNTSNINNNDNNISSTFENKVNSIYEPSTNFDASISSEPLSNNNTDNYLDSQNKSKLNPNHYDYQEYQETLNSMYYYLIIKLILLLVSMSFYTLTFSLLKLERICRGIKCRNALTQLIFRKSLRLKFETSINESSSKAINLIANECTIIEEANNFILFIFLGPIIVFSGTFWIGLALTGLVPVLTSYILMLFSFLIQLYVPKFYKRLINGRLKETKHRIEVTTTFLNSIKVAKMYSWECVFRKIINQVRESEMKWLRRLDTLIVYDIVSVSLLMKFLPTIVYVTYIWLNGDITANVLFIGSMGFQYFVAEGLFNLTRSVRCYIDLKTSCKKIENYLLLAENKEWCDKYKRFENQMILSSCKKKSLISSISIGGNKDINCDHVVISYNNNSNNNNDSNVQLDKSAQEKRNLKYFYKNISASLSSSQKRKGIESNRNETSLKNPAIISNIIDDLNIHIKQGELIIVIGQVGSGKSTLLLTLLGEIKPTAGSITICGDHASGCAKIAYASQEPWILADTIKNNILLGRTFNPLKYQRVIEVCSLERDIKLLPRGDETLVGSKGVSLSGGQKARVNLARCVYSDADIYLLDDPLSAVDTKVSQSLFNNCIKQYLKDKLVVLATHQRQYLKQANKIICLERGVKPIVGTYQDISKSCENYLASNDDGSSGSKSNTHNNNNNNNNMTIDELCIQSCNEGENNSGTDNKRMQVAAASSMNNSNNDNKLKSSYYVMAKIGFSKLSALIVIVTMVIYSPFNAFVDYYLRLWREKIVSDTNDPNIDENQFMTNLFIGCVIYFSISTLNCVVFGIFNLQVLSGLRKASDGLHERLMNSLFSAKMSFYDFCPAGNLGSRYAGDFTQIDHVLKPMLLSCFQCLTWITGFCLMILIIKPICALLFIVLFLLIGPNALKSYRELMKITSLTKQLRAPVYTNIAPVVDELDTIRSDFKFVYFIKEKFNNCQNNLTTMSLLTIFYEYRLATWVKIPTLAVMGMTFYIMFVYDRENLETAKTGVFFMLVNNIVFFFPVLIEMWSTTEASMASVDSVQQLLNLKPEEDDHNNNNKKLENHCTNNNSSVAVQEENKIRRVWQFGRVEFKSVSLRYFEDEKPVLKDLSFVIEPGEKVGVVGRTGAGKSTIVSVLFRLYPFEGIIEIDGINTKQLSLSDLRSSLGVIPQDPVLFCDTLRKNLDPFNEYNDADLWKALEVVELKQHVAQNLSDGLDHIISEGGRNFSVGQRQLVCLARAILKSPKVLVMDEATANVDQDTDILIQKTIKKHFAGSTVITIAHRLNTILDYDKVLVLDAGKIVEYDKVEALLAKENGLFRTMVLTTKSESDTNDKKLN